MGSVMCLAQTLRLWYIVKTWLWLGSKTWIQTQWNHWGLSCDHNTGFELLSVFLIFDFTCDALSILWRKGVRRIYLIKKTSPKAAELGLFSLLDVSISDVSSSKALLSLTAQLLSATLSKRCEIPIKPLSLPPWLGKGRMQGQYLYYNSEMQCCSPCILSCRYCPPDTDPRWGKLRHSRGLQRLPTLWNLCLTCSRCQMVRYWELGFFMWNKFLQASPGSKTLLVDISMEFRI